MREVVIAPKAVEQLQRIIRKLHAWATKTYCGSFPADVYITELLDELESKLDEVATAPETFPHVIDPSLARLGYRRFIVRTQLVVIYRLEDDKIKIRCVFDPRSDYHNLMLDELWEKNTDD